MKIKVPKFNIKNISRYLLLLITTSLFFVAITIALPQTEKVINTQRFDLELLDNNLSAKQYTIDITLTPEQVVNKWKYINQTKDTIYNRLSKFGAQYIKIEYKDLEETKGQLFVSVFTTQDQSTVQSIISQKGEIKIVVKKDEANFEDENDPYARYLETNYNDSGLMRSDFRTIYITKLKTTAGDEAYFGLFKPWIWNTKKYNEFLKANSGKEGGMSIDGFVTPTTIPVFEGTVTNQAKPIFSVGIANEENVAKLQDIILNSGEIPVDYSFKEGVDININQLSYDKYIVFGLMILASGIITIILNMSNVKVPIISLVASVLTFIIYIGYLKIFSIPILSLSLLVGIVFLVLLNIIYQQSKDKLKTIVMISVPLMALYITNLSLSSIFLPTLIILFILYPITFYLQNKYYELFILTIKK